MKNKVIRLYWGPD